MSVFPIEKIINRQGFQCPRNDYLFRKPVPSADVSLYLKIGISKVGISKIEASGVSEDDQDAALAETKDDQDGTFHVSEDEVEEIFRAFTTIKAANPSDLIVKAVDASGSDIPEVSVINPFKLVNIQSQPYFGEINYGNLPNDTKIYFRLYLEGGSLYASSCPADIPSDEVTEFKVVDTCP